MHDATFDQRDVWISLAAMPGIEAFRTLFDRARRLDVSYKTKPVIVRTKRDGFLGRLGFTRGKVVPNVKTLVGKFHLVREVPYSAESSALITALRRAWPAARAWLEAQGWSEAELVSSTGLFVPGFANESGMSSHIPAWAFVVVRTQRPKATKI